MSITPSRFAGLFFFLGVAFLWGCGKSNQTGNFTDQIRRGLGGEPASLDPSLAADTFSQEVLRDLYEGLTSQSPSGEVIPGAASSWQVNAAGDEYIFRIRADAVWSNGAHVRAQDFVTTWQRTLDPNLGSAVADDLRVIANARLIMSGLLKPSELGAQAVSNDILRVRLERPTPYFTEILSHPAAFPIFSVASARSRHPATWISNGAYVLQEWSPGSFLKLRQNSNYWGRSEITIPSVKYEIVTDDNAQFARYRASQIDLTDLVPLAALKDFKKTHPTEIRIAPFLATAYYGLNLSNGAFAHNIDLRCAVAMAIDRARLVQALGFGQVGAYGLVAPGTKNYSPQSWPWKSLGDAERIAEAQRLYSKAGYSRNSPLKIRVVYNSNPIIRNTAIIIASMWHEVLGIRTDLIEEEYRVFLQTRKDKSKWDAVRLGWTADYNDASTFLDTLRTGSANNDTGYSNTFFDSTINAAAASSDQMDRRAMLERAESMMLTEYPIIPLYFFVSKRLVKPYVGGVTSNPLNRVETKYLHIIEPEIR